MFKFHLLMPDHFKYDCEVSTVFIQSGHDILLLKRVSSQDLSDKWAIPGGKLEKDETALHALMREIKEELNLDAAREELVFLKTVYESTLSLSGKI